MCNKLGIPCLFLKAPRAHGKDLRQGWPIHNFSTQSLEASPEDSGQLAACLLAMRSCMTLQWEGGGRHLESGDKVLLE